MERTCLPRLRIAPPGFWGRHGGVGFGCGSGGRSKGHLGYYRLRAEGIFMQPRWSLRVSRRHGSCGRALFSLLLLRSNDSQLVVWMKLRTKRVHSNQHSRLSPRMPVFRLRRAGDKVLVYRTSVFIQGPERRSLFPRRPVHHLPPTSGMLPATLGRTPRRIPGSA
jgi:hypothetical protein